MVVFAKVPAKSSFPNKEYTSKHTTIDQLHIQAYQQQNMLFASFSWIQTVRGVWERFLMVAADWLCRRIIGMDVMTCSQVWRKCIMQQRERMAIWPSVSNSACAGNDLQDHNYDARLFDDRSVYSMTEDEDMDESEEDERAWLGTSDEESDNHSTWFSALYNPPSGMCLATYDEYYRHQRDSLSLAQAASDQLKQLTIDLEAIALLLDKLSHRIMSLIGPE